MHQPAEPEYLTIIVPYRDRFDHLLKFVPLLENFLYPKSFHILVVHQADDKPFNKGKLLNVGFAESKKRAGWICLHDVDTLPMDESCTYDRPKAVTHLAGRVEKNGFVLPYPMYFGGVILATKEAFERVNGFSNEYWGWGREDDDFLVRLWIHNIGTAYAGGRFRSLPHECAAESLENNPRFFEMLLHASRVLRDPAKLELIRRKLCWLQPKISRQLGEEVNPTHDGLSSLDYEVRDRRTLTSAIRFEKNISSEHEIISVRI